MKNLEQVDLAETEIVGLFGYPVEHSFSPVMHNAAFEKLGLNYLYLPFAVQPAGLPAAIAGIRGLNLKGVNLTIPHKEEAFSHLDEISKEAELIGAVNTIKNKDGKLIGHNTDGRGFIRSLEEEKFNVQNKSALIIGAGGAARAVGFQLGLAGIDKLYIANITLEEAENLAQDIDSKLDVEEIAALSLEDQALKEIMDNLDLVVDATPVGMYPDVDVEPVIDSELLHENLLVADLVYNPVETVLLQAAKKAGADTVSGLGMLVHQGAIAFEIWTGKSAPVEKMKEIITQQIENKG